MADQFDEFLHEVKEDLQRERLDKIIRTYGPYVIGGIVLIILGVSAYVYWNYRQLKSQETQSDTYMNAIILHEENKNAEAVNQLNALISQNGDYGMLAQFEKAALLAKNPETKEQAMETYHNMIKDHKIDRRYRSLAVIFYVQLQLDTGNPEEMMKMLQEASVGSNLWPGLISELTALVALRMGEVAQAESILKDLLNAKEASPGVRMRANALLSILNHTSEDKKA